MRRTGIDRYDAGTALEGRSPSQERERSGDAVGDAGSRIAVRDHERPSQSAKLAQERDQGLQRAAVAHPALRDVDDDPRARDVRDLRAILVAHGEAEIVNELRSARTLHQREQLQYLV